MNREPYLLGAAAIGIMAVVTLKHDYENALRPCSPDEIAILAGVDTFHRRYSTEFQSQYDNARKQLPGLPAMNFQSLGLNGSEITGRSGNARTFCMSQNWAVDTVEWLQGVTGGTWAARSRVEEREILIKERLFQADPCNLVGAKIHEQIHLGKFGLEHDDIGTKEEAMQNPVFNYEQSAVLECRKQNVTFDDLRKLSQ